MLSCDHLQKLLLELKNFEVNEMVSERDIDNSFLEGPCMVITYLMGKI